MAYQEGAKRLPEPEHRYAAYAEKCERGHFREHMHSQVELIFVVTGQYRFAAGEQEGIFGPGEIFIANSRETHVGTGLTPPEEEGIYYFVHLSLTKLPRGLSEELDLLLERLQSGEYRLPFRISAEQGRETGLFYRGIELADCWSRTAGCDRFKMLCRTLALWQVILEHHLYADAERRKEEEDPLVKELIAYIDQHYAERLSIESVAKQFGYEPHYFCALFKKKTKATFIKYLNIVRIQRFLSHPNLNMQTIAKCAADVGFSNYSYFHRVFCRICHVTPREYLKHHRE